MSNTHLTSSQRAAMEASPTGGVVAYIHRLREGHAPTFSRPRAGEPLVYSGCACGHTLCTVPFWSFHVDDLINTYTMKIEDLARETARASDLADALRSILDARSCIRDNVAITADEAQELAIAQARSVLAAIEHPTSGDIGDS